MSEEQTEEIKTASLFERVVAFVIDLSIFEILLIAILFFVLKFDLISAHKSLNIFTYIMLFIYFVVARGKTPGKLLVGIQAVNKDGQTPLNLKQSLLRTLGYGLEVLTLLGGLILALFNKQHRTLHDFLGSSMVIRTRKKSASEEMALTILGTIIICSFILSTYYIMFKAPTPFDNKKVALAKEELENLAYLEELHKEHFGYYTTDINRLSLISGDAVQFNRDLQYAFKRKGFKIGLNADKTSYRIEGYAKDGKPTLVFKEKK